jgi:hypothetical protein
MKQVAMDINWCVRRVSRVGMASCMGRRSRTASGRYARRGHGTGRGSHMGRGGCTARGRRLHGQSELRGEGKGRASSTPE